MSDMNLLKDEIVRKIDVVAYWTEKLNAYGAKVGKTIYLAEATDGWSKKVLCPLHEDVETPNLNINMTTGGYKCFACGRHGSLFDYHSIMNGMDPKAGFKRSLIELAKLAGIDINKWRAANQGKVATVPVGHTPKPVQNIQIINEANAIDKTTPPISRLIAESFVDSLTPDHYRYLTNQRGFTLDTIKRYTIGYDTTAKVRNSSGEWLNCGRYTIPILGERKDETTKYPVRNIRKYSPLAAPEQKMFNTEGHGKPPRIFPLHELLTFDWQYVYICEGEFDAILLNQKFKEAGMNELHGAVTGTHGCQSFKAWWLDYFYGRNVIFLYDCDDIGKSASASHLSQYFLPGIKGGLFKSVRNAILPLEGNKQMKDITDYFLKAEGTIEKLKIVISMAPDSVVGGSSMDDASINPEEIDSFITCIKDRRFIDRRVKVPLTISGQTTKLYHAPRSYKVTGCDADDDCCNEPGMEHVLPYGHEIFIQACMANKTGIKNAIQCIACTANKKPGIEICDKVVMQEYVAHQMVKRWRAEENEDGKLESVQELLTVPIYVLQPENNIDIRPQNYMATGWVRSHPSTQQATLFVEHLEPLEDDWKKFDDSDPQSIMHLKKIQSMKVKEILKHISEGVTHIYESNDLLLTVLLSYLAVRRFFFDGEIIRGWMNVAVLGDSGTGKSKTYESISDWIDLGSIFPILSGARTGLLYAIKQRGNDWYVQVGRYVMESGKIIAIDETQDAPPDELKKMAIGMDKGWLDVNQVASAGYTTETRTVFLMNPPEGKTISSYSHGVKALAECFHPMFIRRLDLVIFMIGKDNIEFYNRPSTEIETTLLPDTFRTLVYWAWTRKVDQINWSEEATAACMEQSIKLCEKYGAADDVPLVWPQDFRKKLARMSTALAVLAGSFTDDYTGCNVMPEHVVQMAKFIDACYSSISCNLLQHSAHSRKRKTLEDFDKIRDNFEAAIKRAQTNPNKEYANNNFFVQLLLLLQQNGSSVRKRDIQEQLGTSMKFVGTHLNILQGYNLIEPHQNGYRVTRKFNIFMQRWSQENPAIEKMLNETYAKIGERALMDDKNDGYYYGQEGGGYNGGNQEPPPEEAF